MARPFPRVPWYFTILFMKMQQLFPKKFVKKAEIFYALKKLFFAQFSPQDVVQKLRFSCIYKVSVFKKYLSYTAQQQFFIIYNRNKHYKETAAFISVAKKNFSLNKRIPLEKRNPFIA